MSVEAERLFLRSKEWSDVAIILPMRAALCYLIAR
jgi:hypothetical protein